LDSRADNFFEYCVSVAKEFQSRMSRLRVFVQHNLSSGTANEVILREFLSKHASGNFDVSQGFICDPSEKGLVSRQCDILVYSKNYYPVVYSDGSIKIVWPESVLMVIEVKTNLSKKDIASALENIISAKRLNDRIEGVIFAFQSPKLETVIKHLEAYPNHIDSELCPTAILLLDKGVIIHSWGWARQRDIESGQSGELKPYAIRVGKKDKSAVVVAFLLLLFFQAMQVGRILEADFINALNDMLRKYTEKKLPDIDIGQPLKEETAA
jgi:hypothetical protein